MRNALQPGLQDAVLHRVPRPVRSSPPVPLAPLPGVPLARLLGVALARSPGVCPLWPPYGVPCRPHFPHVSSFPSAQPLPCPPVIPSLGAPFPPSGAPVPRGAPSLPGCARASESSKGGRGPTTIECRWQTVLFPCWCTCPSFCLPLAYRRLHPEYLTVFLSCRGPPQVPSRVRGAAQQEQHVAGQACEQQRRALHLP